MPAALAASIYNFCLILNICPLTTLATSTHIVSPTAKNATQTPLLCNTRLIAITSIMPGIDQTTDINHMITLSTLPPKKPAREPKLIPKSIEIASGIYWGGNFEAVKELIEEDLISDEDIKFFLGYSGWDNHQLLKELNAHSWIVLENVDTREIISRQPLTFWKEKMMQLGGSYALWSNAPENPSYN